MEEILWIPHQQGDKIGHIDGYFQFLGDNLMEGAVELYGGITTGSLLDYNGTDILYQYCKGKGLLQYEHYLPEKVSSYIVYLICKPAEEDYSDASGLYVNFLETSKAVFVPQFGLSEDKKAIDIMEKFTSKPVIPIDCRQIAKYGGGVHCLTREYI